jgi:hypothetical protein
VLLGCPVAGLAETHATPPPVSVRATASKTEVTVGEPFTIDLEALGPAGTSYTFAAEAADETFELRTPEGPPADAATAREPGRHRYTAAVFALGEAQVPPIPVRYRLPDGTAGEAVAGPIEVKVVSLLPKEAQQQKLAEIRGPAPVGIGRAFWVALAGALALVATLAVRLLRRRRGPGSRVEKRIPELPPDVEALGALEALAASGLVGRAEYRAFYIRLTAIAKRYLERRLGAPVVEMTSAETVAFLRGHPHGGELLPAARDLVLAADRIKFARGEGLAAEAKRHVAAVRALVPALEARLGPAAAPPGEGKTG